jgi:hypothetical protein
MRNPHGYLLINLAQDTDDRLRFINQIFPSEVTVVYAAVRYEKDRSNYHLLQALKNASPRLRKAIFQNWNRDLVLGIAEVSLNVLNGNCKISKCGVDRLRKHKTVLRRLVDIGVALHKKMKLIMQRGGFLLPLLTAALSALPSLIQL